MRAIPELILSSAGAWLFESVQQLWMNAILSTWVARCGKISETQVPLCPCWAKAKGDFISGPT